MASKKPRSHEATKLRRGSTERAAGGDKSALAQTWRAIRDSPRWFRIALAGVFAAGVALRVWFVLTAQPVLTSDARDYHDYARSLLEGRGYVQVYHGETAAFEGFTFYAFRPPGYPVFLAGLYAVFGWRPLAALLANVVADAVTQACYVLIAFAVFRAVSERCARAAAVATLALLAVHVLWTPALLSESLYAALFSVLVLLVVSNVAFERTGAALVGGLTLAAALFTRPITVCLYPIISWCVLRRGEARERVRRLGALALPTMIALSFWVWRNYAIFGESVLLATNLGHHNAWDYDLHADRAFEILRTQGLNEARINRELLAAEWQETRDDPAAAATRLLRRIRDLFSLTPPAELTTILWARTFDTGSGGPLAGEVYRVLYGHYYVSYALAAIGAVAMLARRVNTGALIGILVSYVLVHALVSRGDVRLLAPVYPILCVLAAGAVLPFAGRAGGPRAARRRVHAG